MPLYCWLPASCNCLPSRSQHPSRCACAGELAGTGLGLAGGVILATAAAKSDQQVTVGGDMAALLGAFTFVAYLLIGQNLRK